MGQVKYAYAYGSDGVLVNIGGVPKDRTKRDSFYTCLSCGEQMVARHGEKLTPCFAHKPNDACSGETYLHKLGKELFFQAYSRCLKSGEPFELVIPQRSWCDECSGVLKGIRCEATLEKNVDLTKWYDEISMEKPINGFVADILLESSKVVGKPMLIEIAVTHSLSSEKRQSGLRIVEISVSDETELLFLRKPNLIVGEEGVVDLYNFKQKLRHDPVLPSQCGMPINVFLLYPSDRCRVKNFTASEFFAFYKEWEGRLRYFDFGHGFLESDFNSGLSYHKYVNRAYKRGIRFKNCLLCRYHAIGTRRAIFCKFLKDNYSSSKAVECEFFRV